MPGHVAIRHELFRLIFQWRTRAPCNCRLRHPAVWSLPDRLGRPALPPVLRPTRPAATTVAPPAAATTIIITTMERPLWWRPGAPFAATGPPANITAPRRATDAKDSSGDPFERTTSTRAASAAIAWWTRISGISVATAVWANASRPAWRRKVNHEGGKKLVAFYIKGIATTVSIVNDCLSYRKAVQNERDRISSRRPSYEEPVPANGLTVSVLINAETMSRQVKEYKPNVIHPFAHHHWLGY